MKASRGAFQVRNAFIVCLVVVASLLVAACGGPSSTLTGTTWYVTAGSEAVPAWQWVVPPASQGSYTIQFNSDGTFAGKADCNQVSGSYKTSGSDRMEIAPGPTTMAFCGEDSKDVLYISLLGQVSNFKTSGTDLTLTLKDSGTLQYSSITPTASPAPTAAPTPTATAKPTPTASPKPTPSPTPKPT